MKKVTTTQKTSDITSKQVLILVKRIERQKAHKNANEFKENRDIDIIRHIKPTCGYSGISNS